uniref:Putative secreted protein n=1 Tax=Anopheles aquasalis TaxID=42839 RepID=T1DHH1_ANOAQ
MGFVVAFWLNSFHTTLSSVCRIIGIGLAIRYVYDFQNYARGTGRHWPLAAGAFRPRCCCAGWCCWCAGGVEMPVDVRRAVSPCHRVSLSYIPSCQRKRYQTPVQSTSDGDQILLSLFQW